MIRRMQEAGEILRLVVGWILPAAVSPFRRLDDALHPVFLRQSNLRTVLQCSSGVLTDGCFTLMAS